MNFKTKLATIQKKNNSLLCIGLDPEVEKLPRSVKNIKEPFFAFNKAVIDVTSDLVCAYKLNMAFYEAAGIHGLRQLETTITYIKEKHPDIPIILDAKRSDIDNTARMYAKMAFEYFDVDALTVNPYLGIDSLEPYLEYKDKFIMVVVKSSNPGSVDFQDLAINGKPLYIQVAEKIKKLGKTDKIGIVVGATFPEQLKELRKLLPDTIILIPGLGAQGGDWEKTVQFGVNKKKKGVIINVARTIIYAGTQNDFNQKARLETIKIRNKIGSNL